MAAIDHLFAKCGQCGLTCRHDFEGHAALAKFGPKARISVRCSACGVARDYIMNADPRRERTLQAEAREQAKQAEAIADELRQARLKIDQDVEEEWALLRAEMLGLLPAKADA